MQTKNGELTYPILRAQLVSKKLDTSKLNLKANTFQDYKEMVLHYAKNHVRIRLRDRNKEREHGV